MVTERRAIHPNPEGPVRASSPYYRKLDQVRESFKTLLSVAPEEDRSELLLVVGVLDKLLAEPKG